MKSRIGKPAFFVVFILIIVFTVLSTMGISTYYGDIKTSYIWGIDDIRWGIDIRGGVNATFKVPEDYAAENTITEDDLNSAKSILETRLVKKNINDYDVYVDSATNSIIVQFPWQNNDTSFDPQQAVNEIGETALLTFREKYQTDDNGLPTGDTENIILTGSDVESAKSMFYRDSDTGATTYIVQLNFKESGRDKFAEATERLSQNKNGTDNIISIWMDDICISHPTVSKKIDDTSAQIEGNFTAEEATALANKINGGALPFKLKIDSLSTISPILGTGARDAMALAGLIAFILIAIFMILYYKLPGFVAVVALMGQVAGMFAAITGFFGFNSASSLTLPGIAGIILSIGMGVDANVISAERIREEIKAGRTIDGALKNGFSRGFTAILDSNLTVIIVALILMAVFGTWFGATTEGTVYSFGYTLLAGVIMNFIMACWATRMMTIGLSKFKFFRKSGWYGVSSEDIREHTASVEKGKNTVQTIDVQTKTNADFVSRRKIFVIISAAAFALTILFSFVLGVNVDIRFKGGTIITYSYQGEVSTNDIKSTVESLGTPRATVTTGTSFTGGLNTIVVSFAQDEKMDDEMLQNVSQKLIETYPDNEIENIDTTNVSASAGSQFLISCVIAVAIAFVLLVIYIAFRFKKIGGWSAGIIAIFCLLHDVVLTYAVYVVTGMSLDSNFMAVILTLLGYSINNTIIIYDRLRENRAKHGGKMSDRELVNLSINQTLSRSIITTATTVTAMISIAVVCTLQGVTSILSFAIPLAFGMLVGFYSSLCLAGPLWIWHQERKRRNG